MRYDAGDALDSPAKIKSKAYARCARTGIRRLRNDYRNLFLGNEIGAPSATIYRSCGVRFDEKSNWASDMFFILKSLERIPFLLIRKDALFRLVFTGAIYRDVS